MHEATNKFSFSNIASSIAIIISLGSAVVQCSDRDVQYRVQLFSVRAESERKVIAAAENLLTLRQSLMVRVKSNIYDPRVAGQLSKDKIVSDAELVQPILDAHGAFNGALQGELAFWTDEGTVQSLANLQVQSYLLIKCFAVLASSSHIDTEDDLAQSRINVAEACQNVNVPGSADNFRYAEAKAQEEMRKEIQEGGEKLLPKKNKLLFFM